MSIELQWEIEPCIPELESFLSSVADACFRVEGIEGAGFAVRIVDDAAIQALNRDMRGVDRPTDVLSFPMFDLSPGEKPGEEHEDPDTGLVPLGDMCISLERAAAQAEEYGHSVERELSYLAVHSVLHLLGYDHMDEGPMKAQMRRREEHILEGLGIRRG